MIVWGLALLGLLWCWYMESEAHQRAVERKEIDQMADDSRRKQTAMVKLEQRKPQANRSARWVQKSPRLAGRG